MRKWSWRLENADRVSELHKTSTILKLRCHAEGAGDTQAAMFWLNRQSPFNCTGICQPFTFAASDAQFESGKVQLPSTTSGFNHHKGQSNIITASENTQIFYNLILEHTRGFARQK